MGTKITDVKFYLYRADTNEVVQDELGLEPDNGGVADENGIYTFSTTFVPTQNSSFGLDLNAFRVGVWAKDLASNTETITDDELPENANPQDFSMKVRVKERSKPHIQIDNSKWGSHHSSSTFVANFLVWDTNNDYRLAGIDTSKFKISINGTEQIINNAQDYFDPETLSNNPNSDKENGQGYRLQYEFTGLADGNYEIVATIYDNDGNEESVRGIINIDTTLPELILESPEDNLVLNKKEFTVKGSVDTLSTVYVEILRNGETIITDAFEITSLEDNTFNKDYTEEEIKEDGNYTVRVWAVDNNLSSSVSNTIERNFVIDSEIPNFISVKFYPVGSNTPVDFENGESLEYGVQYEIKVMVK